MTKVQCIEYERKNTIEKKVLEQERMRFCVQNIRQRKKSYSRTREW